MSVKYGSSTRSGPSRALPAMTRKSLDIAGVAISIPASDRGWTYPPGHAYRHFVTSRSPDVAISLRGPGQHWEPPRLYLACQSQEPGAWRMYGTGDGFLIEDKVYVANGRQTLARYSLFDRGFSHGLVWIVNDTLPAVDHPFPLRYPLDFLTIANYVARRDGMLLHATAIDLSGHGIVFSGPSGSGKSTLATLWRDASDARVLNHDVVAIRRHEDQAVWVYGTPWWTEDSAMCSREGVPIRSVCFIRHGAVNQATIMPKAEAVHRLVSQCVSPVLYHADLASALIDLCAHIADRATVYDLQFKPGLDVLALVRAL